MLRSARCLLVATFPIGFVRPTNEDRRSYGLTLYGDGMNTIAETGSRAEIRKIRTPPCDVGRILRPEKPQSQAGSGFAPRIDQDWSEWWRRRLQDYAAPLRSAS